MDGEYSSLIHNKELKLMAVNGALISHLGQDRFKGILTDKPGERPTDKFIKEHNINPNIF